MVKRGIGSTVLPAVASDHTGRKRPRNVQPDSNDKSQNKSDEKKQKRRLPKSASSKSNKVQSADAAAAAATRLYLKALKGYIPLAHQGASEEKGGGFVRYVYYRHHTPSAQKEQGHSAEAEAEADEDGFVQAADETGELPAGRTLFVVNVPYHFDLNDVVSLFSCFGDVESVVFKSK
jgi:hypothetical protein